MPIEIKELHISVSVETPPPSGQPAGTAAAPAATLAPADRAALIAACVEQILEILEKKRDR